MFHPGDPFVLGTIVLAVVHVFATVSHFRAGLWQAFEVDSDCEEFRFQEELLHAIRNLKKAHVVSLHFTFLCLLIEGSKCLAGPISHISVARLLLTLLAYAIHVSRYDVNTEYRFSAFRAGVVCIHIIYCSVVASETDLVVFDVHEKICTIAVVCTSVTLIDLQMTIPLYICQSAVLNFHRWALIGQENATPFMVFAPVAASVFLGGVMYLCVHQIRSTIKAKLHSGDASSLMQVFRRVLQGVCDGDVILDRNMTIVDAGCLERLLKFPVPGSKSLRNSNFNFDLLLDLLLDSES